MRRVATTLAWMCLLGAACAACAAPTPPIPNYPALPARPAAQQPQNDDARRLGGRLFDDFTKELALDFVADDPRTPAADGKGGPLGDGTLPDAQGKPLLNTGHGYRLKNLLGWDLHGAAGIASRKAADSACVLLPDLLKNTEAREIWVARLTRGEDAIPAYGSILSSTQIGAIADFVIGVRDGALPHPDELFTFDAQAPGFYRLAPGGDAQRGHALIAQTCSQCHGADGTAFMLDAGAHSLGTFLRSRADEAWLKVLNGVPGTRMTPQLPVTGSRAELTQALRDLLAAGCDRGRYPRGQASQEDVADGDARCGARLK
jgi:mono/diheme cytochrome c family protein